MGASFDVTPLLPSAYRIDAKNALLLKGNQI
jgi:hypothetical protein